MAEITRNHIDNFSRLFDYFPGDVKVLAVACRSDGYWFFCVQPNGNGKPKIYAGCQKNKTFAEYRRHARLVYSRRYSKRFAKGKAKETLAILAALEATAKARWSHG